MDEAPKKIKQRWLPIGMIVVSLIFLYTITNAQAGRQYGKMGDTIELHSSLLTSRVDGLPKPDDMSIAVYLKDETRVLLPVRWIINGTPAGRDYNAAIILCDDEDIEQPLAIWTMCNAFSMEETAKEMVREHSKQNCKFMCVNQSYRSGGFPSPEGLSWEKPSVFKLERYMNFCIDAGEEGRLYIAWAVECYPFAIAAIQLIPVYLLTALLLTALALTKKKALSRGNPCPTSPNPT